MCSFMSRSMKTIIRLTIENRVVPIISKRMYSAVASMVSGLAIHSVLSGEEQDNYEMQGTGPGLRPFPSELC